ncbi:MAG: preprotein translocase subunit SecA [Flavobacteriales bacterium TMED191]|nr:MAG: preprotein translocase subunit SecA [Flavobacteriales bacterium TMED191]|tara:strand:+ start:931 stop:4194 length:3264 start_codon:yes stop_codon:yes gene_type:complete
MSILSTILNLFGTKSQRDMKELSPGLNKTLSFGNDFTSLSYDDLRKKTIEFKITISDSLKPIDLRIKDLKKEIEAQENTDIKEDIYSQIDQLNVEKDEIIVKVLNSIKEEAFAVIKETAKRFTENESITVEATDNDVLLSQNSDHIKIEKNQAIWNTSWVSGGVMKKWDMIHYDVQLIGGLVLHQGKIAEMQTGEGKTLVATLPIYLNALTGLGVHVVTVNDYLAKRDSEWMGPLFEFHGLTVDCIDKYQPNSNDRREAYQCDVTYGTNNEFGFDYLRDNMSHDVKNLVQRNPYFAIIDEVDSVLIDDARTPLIISGAVQRETKQEFQSLKSTVDALVKEQRKLVNSELILAKSKIKDNNEKDGGVNLFRAHRGLPKTPALIKFLSEDGMKTLLQKTENFYMQEQSKNMHIIDDQLYFTIEEKTKGIELSDKGLEFLAGLYGDPDFFLLPDINVELGEVTDANAKDEIIRNYAIKSERMHTMTQLLKAYSLFDKDVDYVVVDEKVKIVDEQTGRIMEGRRYSDGLHQAIEAKENCKIEDATQTLASISLQNYFRMYKKLSGMTGTAETEAGELWDIYKLDVVSIPTNKPVIRKDKEDCVYKTNREKYKAVIDEIVALTDNNRPVLVGTTSVDISEKISRLLSGLKIKHNILNAKRHQQEADIVAQAGIPGTVTIATNMAGRGTDIKLSNQVISSGGLAIIGTERHDSRRVDRQLRGRSGRQGDSGSSQFFVSLEDNLMRIMGSDRIAKIIDSNFAKRFGGEFKDGDVIQHPMITKSIERAQKKIEENNYGIRKRLLEYDDVMNSQREVIYKRRKNALFGERLSLDVSNMIYDVVYSILEKQLDQKNIDELKSEFLVTFSNEDVINFIDMQKINDSIEKQGLLLTNQIRNLFNDKLLRIKEEAFPVIKRMHESNTKFNNVRIPFSDGLNTIGIVCNIDEVINSGGDSLITSFTRDVILACVDKNWKEHLKAMDDLKQSVQGAVYEQKDPLLIYKFESFKLFNELIEIINKDAVSFLFKANLPKGNSSEPQSISRNSDLIGHASRGKEERAPSRNQAINTQNQQKLTRQQKRAQQKNIKRGSGGRFKKY